MVVQYSTFNKTSQHFNSILFFDIQTKQQQGTIFLSSKYIQVNITIRGNNIWGLKKCLIVMKMFTTFRKVGNPFLVQHIQKFHSGIRFHIFSPRG